MTKSHLKFEVGNIKYSVFSLYPLPFILSSVMRYLTLATDYDGTLATDGHVNNDTITALERLRKTGRKLILVTGRQLDDLMVAFPYFHLLDAVVAENGAVLHLPSRQEVKLLGEPPKAEFIHLLQQRGVNPLSIGSVIVATWHPQESTVAQVMEELGLELQVILNKGAVMILPAGVNKASGLSIALEELGLSPHSTVAVGDAENDTAMLTLCACGVAVANALPIVKAGADFVTEGERGAGVVELIDKLVNSDLREIDNQ